MAWTPGTYPATMGSHGFTVDTSDRNDVVGFWHAVYQASEGYGSFKDFAAQWGGSYTAGSPFPNSEGVNPAGLVTHTERRVNYFRAMAGIPASVRLNTSSTVRIDVGDLYSPPGTTTKAAAVQRSAYMIIRTYGTNLALLGNPNAALSHNPVAGSCVAWTTAAWNSNFRGNLARGFYGPGAVDAYLLENVGGLSDWNSGVGHRRWVLNSGATNMATGDTPGSYNPTLGEVRPPTNTLYVVQKPDEQTAGLTPFVPWPSAGYFPAMFNTRFWSLSRAGANFSAATISMTTEDGVVVPVVKQAVVSGLGENTVVWEVPESARVQTVSADTRYHVTVSGMTGTGVPASYSYSVTLMDPNAVTSDQNLVGTASPPTTGVAKMLFSVPSKAEGFQVNAFQPVSTAWTEGGEDATQALVLDRRYSPASYDLRAAINSYGGTPTNFFRSGSKALRLTFPTGYDLLVNGPRDQIFELDRMIVPKVGGELSFYHRQALMTSLTRLRVETSADDGVTWTAAGSDVVGNIVLSPFSGNIDNAFLLKTVPLPVSSQPLRVRFRYFRSAFGGVYAIDQLDVPNPGFRSGIFIDDITTTNCDWLELRKTNELAVSATSMNFNSTTAGVALAGGQQWRLRMRAKLGNRWMPYGPVKSLSVVATPLTGFDSWLAYENPDLTGGFSGDHDGDGVKNGLEYAFGKDPRVADVVAGVLERDVVSKVLTLRLPLASAKAGVSYGVEWSENLESWSSVGTTVTFGGGQVIGKAPMGSGARYVRWKVTKL